MVNIIGHRKINLFISTFLFVLSLVFLLVFGLKAGIDFKGGSLLQVSFTNEVPAVAEVREAVKTLNYGEATVQSVTEGMLLKMKFLTEEEHQALLTLLRTEFGTAENQVLENRFETIGPAVSADLRTRSFYAITAVIIGIVVYVAYAFRRISKPIASWKYGLTAVVAIFHDVIITMGIFAVLGYYFDLEVGLPFVVALLTILGYSVNDTIVVFDRVRENLIRHSSEEFATIVNMAINQTFARSINTTATTLFTLLALFFFGGVTIKYFVLALSIGIFLGAYSSIFVASPILVEIYNWQMRKVDR